MGVLALRLNNPAGSAKATTKKRSQFRSDLPPDLQAWVVGKQNTGYLKMTSPHELIDSLVTSLEARSEFLKHHHGTLPFVRQCRLNRRSGCRSKRRFARSRWGSGEFCAQA